MYVEGTIYRQVYQPLFRTRSPHPSLCLQSYLIKAEQYEHQKWQIRWKSNLFSFLSDPSLPSRMLLVQIVQQLCNKNYWKEATHLSRRSEFLHHPMLSLLAASRIFTLSHRRAHNFRVHFADERNCEQPRKPHSEI